MADGRSAFGIAGRTAIVTGASSGLGAAFATALAEAGANVVLAARRANRIDDLAATIEDTGGRALAVPCDVTDPEEVASLAAATVDRFGRLDVMVANAGTAADAGPMAEKLPQGLFEHVVAVNLVGAWHCMREAGARMLAQGDGSIIAVSSAAGIGGVPYFPPAYQATKAAIINLARNLAVTWADRGVRVNVLAPGWFPSEMTEALIADPVYGEHLLRSTPMGRVGRVEELEGALLYLASDLSSFTTGHTLVVDGGASAGIGPVPYSQELLDFHASLVPGGLGRPITPAG